MSKIASKVFLIEVMQKLNTSAIFQERVAQNLKIEVHIGTNVESILGKEKVKGQGIVGNAPKRKPSRWTATSFTSDCSPTSGISRCRAESSGQVVTAVDNGAITAGKLLQQLQ